MPKIFKNKFKQVFYELTNLCEKCKDKEDIDCPDNKRECGKYNLKFKELYYDLLYPWHPCKICLVRAACDKTVWCEDLNHHDNMRDVAKSELEGHQIFFSKKRIKLLHGHPDLITEEDLRQTNFNGEKIDFEFTKKYIKEIKNDSNYEELLETEKQRFEHFYRHNFIKDKNGRWIIDPSNSSK